MKRVITIIIVCLISIQGFSQIGFNPEVEILKTQYSNTIIPVTVKNIDNTGGDEVVFGEGSDFGYFRFNIDTFDQFMYSTLGGYRFRDFVDFNNDGLLDVVTVSGSSNSYYLSWGENFGYDVFSQTEQNIGNSNLFTFKNIVCDDFNQDNYTDVLVYLTHNQSNTDYLLLYKNNSSQQFTADTLFKGGFQMNGFRGMYYDHFIHTFDINNDGYKDIFFRQGSNIASIISGTSGLQTYNSNVCSGEGILFEDLNNDSFKDLVYRNGSSIYVKYNDQNGSFGNETALINQSNIKWFKLADLDNDNDFDVVTISNVDNRLAYHENQGNSNFGNQTIIDVKQGGLYCVDIGDFDNNGFVDIAFAYNYQDGVSIDHVLGVHLNMNSVGIDDSGYDQEIINVYPNPVVDYLTIQGGTINRLYDVMGKLLIETTNKKIDMSQFTIGTYILNIDGFNYKVIKTN